MAHSAPITLRSQTPETIHAHLDHDRLMDCIHCGLCLSQCPTYAEEGLEADSPRGRIYLMRALAEGRSELTPALVEHLDSCLGCRACETACPSGVQYGHLIEGARSYLRLNYKRPWKQRMVGLLVEASFPYPARLEAALLPVRVLRRTGILPLLHRVGFMKLLGNLGAMEQMLPPLPPMRKRIHFPTAFQAKGTQQARVGMITGCVMQVMQSDVNEATARVLSRSGCRVEAPREQVCCGALHAHIGGMDEARAFARKNIEVFEALQKDGDLDAIVINAAGCGAALKEYTGWFKDDVEWAGRAKKFSDNVKDVSQWLAEPRFKSRLESLMSPRMSTHAAGKADSQDLQMRDIPRETMPNAVGATTLQALGEDVPGREDNQLEAVDVDGALSVDESLKNRAPVSSQCAACTTYHDACHLAHGQGIRVEPRELMASVANMNMVPLPESEMCCGSAGVYNITQPAMAMQLLERKMKHIKATGAQVVVTGNPGCMMQLMMGAKKFDVDVQIKHPVEILDEATRNKSRGK